MMYRVDCIWSMTDVGVKYDGFFVHCTLCLRQVVVTLVAIR